MKKITRFKHKKIVVIGLAISGYHVALLLNKLGAQVIVNDASDLTNDDHAKQLREKGISVIGDSHPLELIDHSVDYIIKNPGIPYEQPQIKKALTLGIPILTDVEVAFDVAESHIIAITGTNGKTTTTRMVETVLNQNRTSGTAFAAGNIGISASEVSQEVTAKDDMVFELSSFQLMGIDTFKPEIAVITNLYSAHLDYHGTQEAYEAAKMRITQNQDAQDYIVYNADQPKLVEYMKETKAIQVPFSRLEKTLEGAYIEQEWMMFKGTQVMRVEDVAVKGTHNLENALATVAVAKLKGQTNEAIQKRVESIHRSQT